jgi:hypothetical protein
VLNAVRFGQGQLTACYTARFVDTQAALSEEMANGIRLSVELDGSGSGTVIGGGINCPGTCSAGETPQSSVTLTATPAAGSTFTGWSGACTGTGTRTVALPYDQNVIATFESAWAAGAGGTPSASGVPPAGGAAAGVRCRPKPVSTKVLLAARKGKAAKGAPKPGSVKAGRALTLPVKLPAAAVSALADGAKESATFTGAVVGPGGGGRATTKLAMLKGTR